jgi:biopolymer transport protein TolR
MATSIGSHKSGPVADPNIVPLIDVLLVLIILFMVITPRLPTGLPTLVPQLSLDSRSGPRSPIVVQVLPGEKLLINRELSDWTALGPRLSEIYKDRADKVTFVKGSAEVSFEQVARAIDIMRGAGIDRAGLITPATLSAN